MLPTPGFNRFPIDGQTDNILFTVDVFYPDKVLGREQMFSKPHPILVNEAHLAGHGSPGYLKTPSFSSFFEINYFLHGQVFPRLTHFSFRDDDAFPHKRNGCLSFIPLSLVAPPPSSRMSPVVGETKGHRFPKTTEEYRTSTRPLH